MTLLQLRASATGLHPAWLSGFIDGEACFQVLINPNATIALGFQVQLVFTISQHMRDTELLNRIVSFFGGGTVTNSTPTQMQYRLRDTALLGTVLFDLLDAFPLQSEKRLDAEAFRKVYYMMKEGKHLTAEGLTAIRDIKATMNRARMTKYKPKLIAPVGKPK